jgi:hypothetical protein
MRREILVELPRWTIIAEDLVEHGQRLKGEDVLGTVNEIRQKRGSPPAYVPTGWSC